MDATSRRYGTVQTVLFCAYTAAYFLAPGSVLFDSRGAALVGSGLCGVGLGLMIASVWTLRRVIQVAPEPRADAHLVTRGPYATLRHPIYTGILMVVIGLCLRRPTLAVVLMTLAVVVYLVLKVRLEERLLLTRYPGYAEYRTRSFGLVPGLGRDPAPAAKRG